MDELVKIADHIREKTKIDVRKKDVEKILSAMKTSSHFWEVVNLSQKPFPVIKEMISLLLSLDFIKTDSDGNILFTQKGSKLIHDYNIPEQKTFICPYCEGRGMDISELKDIYKEFKRIVKSRPDAIADYDQGYVTEETAISRVALMIKKNDIQSKHLIVFGDDDLVSIAASLTKLPKEVLVLEIDKRIVDFINDIAKVYNLSLMAFEYDFRNKLPENLLKAFDTFIIDPPETIDALNLCFERTISTLRGVRCAGYFGLTNIESSIDKWYEVQKLLVNKFHAVITDIIENFNHYVNWSYLLPSLNTDLDFINAKPKLNWYTSSMFRIELMSDYEIKNEYTDCELYIDNEAILYKA